MILDFHKYIISLKMKCINKKLNYIFSDSKPVKT